MFDTRPLSSADGRSSDQSALQEVPQIQGELRDGILTRVPNGSVVTVPGSAAGDQASSPGWTPRLLVRIHLSAVMATRLNQDWNPGQIHLSPPARSSELVSWFQTHNLVTHGYPALSPQRHLLVCLSVMIR